MATIPPHPRLKDVENAANFMALVQDNFEVLAAELALRQASYLNGAPTTIIGPPTSGTHVLDEFWRDALLGEWTCTAAGTPGTWKQSLFAPVTADPSSGTIPVGYVIYNTASGQIKVHAGGYVWNPVAADHTHPAADISDSTAAGRTILTAADAAAQRTALGLGDAATKNVGDTAGTVAAGDHTHAPQAGQKRGCVLALCLAFTPTATGADAGEVVVPFSPTDGTTPLTWNVRRLTLRVAASGGAPSVTLQKSTAAGAFVASDLGAVTLASDAYEGSVTSSLGSVASGDKLRFSVAALGTATGWSITVELGEA
jgi:hypothetical protein